MTHSPLCVTIELMPLPKKSIADNRSAIVTNKGFTLIELLISITVISILIGMGALSWNSGQVKSRDSRRKADLKTIAQSLDSYFLQNGEYPPKGAVGTVCGQIYNLSYLGTTISSLLVPAFLPKLPLDPTYPSSTSDYFYLRTGPASYKVYAILENPNDQEYNSSYVASDGASCGSLTSLYHYRVVSP